MKNTFVKVVGVVLGIVWVAYGVVMMLGGVPGTGPCRIDCQTSNALLTLLGQKQYSVIVGATWVLCGFGFIYFILRVVRKDMPRRKRK